MTWKPVLNWEGIYEVSSTGDLRSVDRWISYVNGSQRLQSGQSKKIHFDKDGYARASLCRPDEKVTAQMHVLVCEAFHGPRPSEDSEVCHANDIRTDNRAENLSWGTRQSNAAEMRDRDRIKGEKHPRAKLTAFQVFMMREIPNYYGINRDLSKAFGVSYGTIMTMRTGQNWGWL